MCYLSKLQYAPLIILIIIFYNAFIHIYYYITSNQAEFFTQETFIITDNIQRTFVSLY